MPRAGKPATFHGKVVSCNCDDPSSFSRSSDRSGSLWSLSATQRANRVKRICAVLERTYGRPNLGNPTDPLDDLVYIVLSNRTGPAAATGAYEELKARFPKWNALLDADPRTLQRQLQPLGLWKIRARHLRAALRQIRRDFGTCDLSSLRGQNAIDCETYLGGLPGVSTKVAKCVAMFTLGAEVLPVDAHVHRVTRRLGWIDRKRADQCHDELETLVPPKRRYTFHVDCILHGRKICRPARPRCSDCVVRRYCAYSATRGSNG